MKWKLKEIIQETAHPFLNYFTLIYDAEKDDGSVFEVKYYLVSRHKKEELVAKTGRINRPDGVVMPLYHIDENGEVSFLLTHQFRPAVNNYMTSFVAGLVDKDEDLFEAAKREAKEESGAIITELELLSGPAPTSVGLSDEPNSVVLGRIVGFEKTNLEDCEDITTDLYSLTTIKNMLNDSRYIFPVNIRILLLYLIQRFTKS